MKYLKKINELLDEFDHFDEISPEQAYKELEQEMDLPKKEDIKDEIDSAFDFIESDGLNPYEMTFDEFYNWTLENFRLEHPKSYYETEFKNKIINPNQLKLPFKESMKHLISFNETSNKKIMDVIGSNLLKHKEYAKKNKVSVNVNRVENLSKKLAERFIKKYNDPEFYSANRFSYKELDSLGYLENEEKFTEEEILKIKGIIHPLLNRGFDLEESIDNTCISLYLYSKITISPKFGKGYYDDDDDLLPYNNDDRFVRKYINSNNRNQFIFNLAIFKHFDDEYEIVVLENEHDIANHYFLINGLNELIQFLDDLLNKN